MGLYKLYVNKLEKKSYPDYLYPFTAFIRNILMKNIIILIVTFEKIVTTGSFLSCDNHKKRIDNPRGTDLSIYIIFIAADWIITNILTLTAVDGVAAYK